MQLVNDNQEYKANQLLEERKSEILSVMQAPATLAMGNMSPPDMAKFRQDIATSKAMAMGVNPDLVQNQVGEQRYNGANPNLPPVELRGKPDYDFSVEARRRMA